MLASPSSGPFDRHAHKPCWVTHLYTSILSLSPAQSMLPACTVLLCTCNCFAPYSFHNTASWQVRGTEWQCLRQRGRYDGVRGYGGCSISGPQRQRHLQGAWQQPREGGGGYQQAEQIFQWLPSVNEFCHQLQVWLHLHDDRAYQFMRRVCARYQQCNCTVRKG